MLTLFATTALSARNGDAIIDDVPVEKTPSAPEHKLSNQSTGAGEAAALPPFPAQESLDIPSAFLDWCREKIRSKKAIINESSGMIQKVRFGDKSVVAVVTPRVFAEFGQEVLGLSLEASERKATSRKSRVRSTNKK